MLRKFGEGFWFGLGFSIASLIVATVAWFAYDHIESQPKELAHPVSAMTSANENAQLQSQKTSHIKECSLLILLYGENHDPNVEKQIAQFCSE